MVNTEVNSLFYPIYTSEPVMSFWWQQVECYPNAPLQHRQTGRWSQRPMLPKPRSSCGERNRSSRGSPWLSAVCLKQNQPASLGCFPQCTLYPCMYPHSSVQKPLCTVLAFLSCILLAVALFGFLSSSTDLLLSASLSGSLLLSFWMQSSLYAIDFCFLSSQPPPTLMPQWLLNQARAWPQTASPWAYWENQSWDCLKWRRVTSSKRGCTNRCAVIFLD